MTYKEGDLVYFDGDGHEGVGEIVSIRGDFHLVRSTQIVGGHTGAPFVERQDVKNSWWYYEENLKPFTKKEGQKYKVIGNDFNDFEIGEIVTLSIVGKVYGVSYYKKDDAVVTLYDIDHPGCEVEFYADAEEHKENEMFTKDDLQVGYVVKTKSGKFAQVVFLKGYGLCILYENRDGLSLGEYSDDLSYNGKVHDIEEVYGHAVSWVDLGRFGAGNRELLWKRNEIKEMTLAELQEHFGYEIKVVE